MDVEDFWSLLEAARTDAAAAAAGDLPDGKALAAALVDRLAGTSRQAIFEYEHCFERLDSALNRWDVWAAAYLINRGCSDDSFMDFRAGVVAQGRNWYERAVARPDSLADHPHVLAVAAARRGFALLHEPVIYVASYAYERINGDEAHSCAFYEDYDAFTGPDAEPGPAAMGEDFDFDDPAEMRARLPRLAGLFLSGSRPA